jgi:hypothetical protein
VPKISTKSENKKADEYSYEPQEIAEILVNNIRWKETKEGYDYWVEVYKNLLDIK